MREYELDMDRDTLRQLGIKPPNRPLQGPHGENHRLQCETINNQILDTIASQQPLAAERQKLNMMHTVCIPLRTALPESHRPPRSLGRI
jgi:hypothetical protein